MGKTNPHVEAWQCVQAHRAMKKIEKVLEKYEIEDFMVFIRTEDHTFLRGHNEYSPIISQLSHLIANLSSEIDKSPDEIIDDLKDNAQKARNLQAQAENIVERVKNDELDAKGMEEAVKKLAEEYEVNEIELIKIMAMMK